MRLRATALVTLLPEDAPPVRAALRQLGKGAVPALVAATRHADPQIRSRARAELLRRARRHAAGRLAGFALGLCCQDQDGAALERGLFLLDRFLDPCADIRQARALLERWGDELVALRASDGDTHTADSASKAPAHSPAVTHLVHLLAERHGLRGRREDYHHPDHTSLSRTLTRRAGLPLTLCAVYQAVARRAGLVAHLLPFPGHVLLEVREGGQRWILDPFDSGKVLTARQCLLRLATLGIPFRERWLTAASDRDMLARQVHNLAHALGGARPHGAGHGPSHAPRVRGASRCELRLLEGTLEAFATPGPRR